MPWSVVRSSWTAVGRVVLAAAWSLAACAPPATVDAPIAAPTAAHHAVTSEGDPSKSVYPARFPVVAEAELAESTIRHQKRTPGWTITLDLFGMLSSARCKVCQPSTGKLMEDDREQIAAFLAAQDDLLALSQPEVVVLYDRERERFYQQKTASGIAAFVHVSRGFDGAVTIQGHMWPHLPPAGTWLPDATLEPKLRALDATAELELAHTYQAVARQDDGPVEIHEAVCLALPKNFPRSPEERKSERTRPCLDARTGEDLTWLKTGWSVSETNGAVTSRRLTRVQKPSD